MKIPFDSNRYRVYHLVKFEEVLYVLEAGMKKSNEKSEIPTWQRTRLEERIKAAQLDYAGKVAEYKDRYTKRSSVRTAQDGGSKFGRR